MRKKSRNSVAQRGGSEHEIRTMTACRTTPYHAPDPPPDEWAFGLSTMFV
ncbi:MAG: hypothetical protein KF912_14280 [Phycisphaeraceae bacterium]|nr:hypothetical protein [Phycisphaeraceae bacterium]MBX3368473.1 hypothetical protein [Phycisphaeraceae bacterium]